MKEVIKYTCEHCKREYKVKVNAEKHEAICWKNPGLKTCLTCVNFGGFEYMQSNADIDFGEYAKSYIVCKHDADLPMDKRPVINCLCWVHDKRTKKQKQNDILKELMESLDETGLTF